MGCYFANCEALVQREWRRGTPFGQASVAENGKVGFNCMLTADCERPSCEAAQAKLLRSVPTTIVHEASMSNAGHIVPYS